MDVEIMSVIKKRRTVEVYKIKWWNPTGENVATLSEKIKTEGKWRLEGDANKIWEGMAECIRKSAREVLGVSRGGNGRMKGAWWRSKEVKEKVKPKQEKDKALADKNK